MQAYNAAQTTYKGCDYTYYPITNKIFTRKKSFKEEKVENAPCGSIP